MQNNHDLKVTLLSNEREIVLSLSEGEGVITSSNTVYRFNQGDNINDVVSDINLYFLINITLGNALFSIITEWLEETK